MSDYLSFPDRPLVYVAGPYVRPDPVDNTNKTIKFADRLHRTGKVTCVVPHLTLLWHVVAPHEPDYWYDLDLATLARCDALFRLPGDSTGADREVEFAGERGIPVFYSETDLLYWAAERGRDA
jgi:Domain of unknown function (DUF4406)